MERKRSVSAKTRSLKSQILLTSLGDSTLLLLRLLNRSQRSSAKVKAKAKRRNLRLERIKSKLIPRLIIKMRVLQMALKTLNPLAALFPYL
jgi:hypothetical protein